MSKPPTDEAQLCFIGEAEELVVYRNVKSDDLGSDAFLASLRSNEELGRPMRGQELTHPLIYSGVSVWDTLEAAAENARTFPALGGFVAEIRLDQASDARYFGWGTRPGHLTVWAEPQRLLEGTVSTIPVRG